MSTVISKTVLVMLTTSKRISKLVEVKTTIEEDVSVRARRVTEDVEVEVVVIDVVVVVSEPR